MRSKMVNGAKLFWFPALLLIIVASTANAQDKPTTVAFDEAPLTPSSVPVDSNLELINAVNSMDRALSGEAHPRNVLRDRLVVVGLLGGTFLALLGVLFCYLRLEHASRGFYSGRLQMSSVVAVVIILLVCYLLWSQVMFK